MTTRAFLEAVTRWASGRPDIDSLALVGSHARGDAGPESDIDLVLLCRRPNEYLGDTAWVSDFGEPERIELEDRGLLQSVRVHYPGGPEVEFGLGSPGWAADPPPPGTMEVLTGGVVVLFDRSGSLKRLAGRIRAEHEDSQ